MQEKRVFVAGATGVIGIRLCKMLLEMLGLFMEQHAQAKK